MPVVRSTSMLYLAFSFVVELHEVTKKLFHFVLSAQMYEEVARTST